MSATLCGHERKALIWALHAVAALPRQDIVTLRFRFDESVASDVGKARNEACAQILDPAKLAELMAEELRRRGAWARVDMWHEGAYSPELGRVVKTRAHYVSIADDPANSEEHEEHQCIGDICEHYATDIDDVTLPQARTALLSLMQLPEGALVADVLKALEVRT